MEAYQQAGHLSKKMKFTISCQLVNFALTVYVKQRAALDDGVDIQKSKRITRDLSLYHLTVPTGCIYSWGSNVHPGDAVLLVPD